VCYAPQLAHAKFAWSKALLSMAIVFAGIASSWLLTSRLFGARDPRLAGLTARHRLLGAGHRLLVEKYYLDALYERVVVRAIVGPVARGAYAFNQRGLDGIIHAVAAAARVVARVVYGTLDQRVVDGTVNGAGAVAHRAGAAAQPAQSGRVSQYGALLFGAAAAAALVLVLTTT
jgi:NADH-quinone oxidoreductase subunit L